MKYIITIFASLLFAATTVLAVAPNSYQVTGFVLEVTGDLIVVQKGRKSGKLPVTRIPKSSLNQRWEIRLPFTIR
jgi:hypothetical protein